MRQPVEDAVSVDPWGFYDSPFVHRTRSVETFLLFLADEGAEEWEIVRMRTYAITFRLSGEGGSDVYLEAYSTSTKRTDKERLAGMLSCYPIKMSKVNREKLANIVGIFFGLQPLCPGPT